MFGPPVSGHIQYCVKKCDLPLLRNLGDSPGHGPSKRQDMLEI